MKIIASFAALAATSLSLIGTAEALPVAPVAARPAVVDVAVVVTKTVRRGPFGGVTVTRRVVRRPMMGRTVTTTRVVR